MSEEESREALRLLEGSLSMMAYVVEAEKIGWLAKWENLPEKYRSTVSRYEAIESEITNFLAAHGIVRGPHVWVTSDGERTRCGGPKFCKYCDEITKERT